MKLANTHKLKVLLDGQGGDETLAGYFRYLPTRLRDLAAAGQWSRFAQLFGPVSDRLGLGTTLLHTFEPWLPDALVVELRRRFGQGKDRVLSSRLRKTASQAPHKASGTRSGLWDQLAFDTLVRQLPSLLRYEDRSSMAFAIETRLPFLDYRLVEFAFSLPDTERLDGTTTKAIARRALGDRVPKSVLERRDKMGFETPTDLWFRGRHAAEVRKRLTRQGPFQEWGVARSGSRSGAGSRSRRGRGSISRATRACSASRRIPRSRRAGTSATSRPSRTTRPNSRRGPRPIRAASRRVSASRRSGVRAQAT
jgi:asparagine synthetase B (glutamine-hydrolysing)